MAEIWKDVVGYEGLYQVSSLGNVRSLNYRRTGKTHLLKYAHNKEGYCNIALYNKGVAKSHLVHRLVAKAFIPNPLNKPQINHKSEIKNDNSVVNLEWVTPQENITYNNLNLRRAETLRQWVTSEQGKEHYEKQGEMVRKTRSIPVVGIHMNTGEKIMFSSAKEASRNGFNQGAISACLRGESAHHKKYKWFRNSGFEVIQLQG